MKTVKNRTRLANILQELALTYDNFHYYASAEPARAARQALPHLTEVEQKKVRIVLLDELGYSAVMS